MNGAGGPDNACGMRAFIVGTGGIGFTGLGSGAPNSQVRNNTTFGVLKLTLHPTSYDWQFVPVAGQTFTDAGSFPTNGCSSTPTPTASATSTATPTPVPTSTATQTLVPTSTATQTPVPTSTATPTSVPTSTPTPTVEPTSTATETPVPTSTPTQTTIPTSTATETPLPTSTPTSTPCAGDTDCDSYFDSTATLHEGPANTNASVDNCPGVFNNPQLNADGNIVDNSPPYSPAVDDRTWPNSDAAGDACDADDDNDGINDVDEASGAICGGVGTNSLLRDTDGDRFLDGAECVRGTNPTVGTSRPVLSACGLVGDADNDKVADRVEVCFHNTNPNQPDTDGDGAKDGCEATSLNGDRIVNSLDQAMLAQGILGVVMYTANVDINKDGVLNSIDQGIMASFIVPPGQCP